MDQGCGSGNCGCGNGGAATATLPDPIDFTPVDKLPPLQARPTASVNGVALHPEGQAPDDDTLRQRDRHFRGNLRRR